jgi:hypothetical protein
MRTRRLRSIDGSDRVHCTTIPRPRADSASPSVGANVTSAVTCAPSRARVSACCSDGEAGRHIRANNTLKDPLSCAAVPRDTEGMRVRDVRIESRRRDHSSFGVTALVEDVGHTLIQFSFRHWPGDGSESELTWTAFDQGRQVELKVRGGGFGGSVQPGEGAAFEGGIWLDGLAHGPLHLQCRHRDELLIDVDLKDGHIVPISSPVQHLAVLEAMVDARDRGPPGRCTQ